MQSIHRCFRRSGETAILESGPHVKLHRPSSRRVRVRGLLGVYLKLEAKEGTIRLSCLLFGVLSNAAAMLASIARAQGDHGTVSTSWLLLARRLSTSDITPAPTYYLLGRATLHPKLPATLYTQRVICRNQSHTLPKRMEAQLAERIMNMVTLASQCDQAQLTSHPSCP
jgi:hypothetical protein